MVHPGHPVHHLDGALGTGLDAAAEAQTAVGALIGAVSGDLRRGGAVLEALIAALFGGVMSPAFHQSHLAAHFHRLHAHNGGNGVYAFLAPGGAEPQGGAALYNGLGIGAAAAVAAAAAVGPGKGLGHRLQPLVLLDVEHLGGHSQHQTEDAAHNAQH